MPASLYYTPTSCGAASFIAAFKAGIIGTKVREEPRVVELSSAGSHAPLLSPLQVHAYEVDTRAHIILAGPDKGKSFYDVNPKVQYYR